MTSVLAGLPLRYLIGLHNDQGIANTVTEPGYEAAFKPTLGSAIAYANCRQESAGRRPGVDYIDPPDDIEQEYGEPAFEFDTDDFWQNLHDQLIKWVQLGFDVVEVDNLDTYNTLQALDILDFTAHLGLSLAVKNPTFVEGDNKRLVAHPFAVMMICEHDDELTAKELDDLRKAAGRPDMPIRVVSYGDQRGWAEDIARQAEGMVDFGVTYSSRGEYQNSMNLRLPMADNPNPTPPTSPTPWVETLPSYVGKFHDGPDVPAMAVRTARRFPDDTRMASYVTQMGNNTAWCGLFAGEILSQYRIKPPLVDFGVGGWAYVDAWLKLEGGTRIDPSARRDGDLALWLKPDLHHISFCYQGKYLGGNQANTVNVSSFRTPDAVIRPPAPASYAPTPESMPMLMIESTGDMVRYLQTLLNADLGITLDIDGDFGAATEAAVKQYQTKYSLEVDGIVGQETWASLMAPGKPVPKPPEPAGPLTSDQVIAIMNMAEKSAIAKYSWKNRGVAPLGYTKGMAVMFGQCLAKLAANDSQTLVMSQPIGTSSKDALAWYTIQATGRENVLRKNFVMLFGLGMRESSGNYTEGRDASASNVTADTAEAGLFQQSWNSASASNEMQKLLPEYSKDEQPCYVETFKEGVTQKVTKNFGSGEGYAFQELAKTCPAFAVEMAAVGIRVLYNHWGPIIRKEVEFRAEAETLLLQVAAYINETPGPEPEPPEPPASDIAKAKAECMASIELAVNKLIADLVAMPTDHIKPEVLDAALDAELPPLPEPDLPSQPPPPMLRAVPMWDAPAKTAVPAPIIDQATGQAIGAAIFDSLLAALTKGKG